MAQIRLLTTRLPPLINSEDECEFPADFESAVKQCDRLEIAVGYVSQASLEKLDSCIGQYHIYVLLIMGMYKFDGVPESILRTAQELNKKWMAHQCGEIRLVNAFKYHGNIYSFSKGGTLTSVILGSANLTGIAIDSSNRRQFEVSTLSTDLNFCTMCRDLIQRLKHEPIAFNLADLSPVSIPIIPACNAELDNMPQVSSITAIDRSIYARHAVGRRFLLPLKAPHFSERFMDDGKHYTQSNLNICYAAPRGKHKARDWYEILFTVPSTLYKQPDYPQKGCPFLAVTDDGFSFKVHTAGSNNKQLSAVGDKLLLGRWFKGRLAAAGIVKPVTDTSADTDRLSMITQEMLDNFGCHYLYLQKTDKVDKDEDGNEIEIWLLGFAFDKDLPDFCACSNSS